jgi:DNA repair protein RadC
MNKLTIKEWEVDDRPREKLFKYGEGMLSDAELLALLLRTGVKGHSALDLARKMIRDFGSLRNMASCDVSRWKPVKGLGPAKIAQIKAAFELGRRFLEEKIQQERPQIHSAQDAADLLAGRMRDLKVEVFKVIYLDSQNRVIDIEDAAQGTVNQVTPIIREILHKALGHYASGLICAHNHPSGSLSASPQDKVFTRSLKEACVLMGLRLIDHIVISPQGYCSVF